MFELLGLTDPPNDTNTTADAINDLNSPARLRAIEAIPSSFYDVWTGPMNVALDAYSLGLLSAIAPLGHSGIAESVSTLGAARIIEIIESTEISQPHSLTDNAARLYVSEPELLAMMAALPKARGIYELAQSAGARLLTIAEGNIPSHLGAMGPEAPYALWARGDLSLLDHLGFSLTVDGSMTPTEYGTHMTRQLVYDAAERNIIIISGGLYGIQAEALNAALAINGHMILVSTAGVNYSYPSGNKEVFDAVAQRGLVLSAVAPGTLPNKTNDRMRRRLLAALSPATFIAEGTYDSDALVTARHAKNLGKIVTALPGSVSSRGSEGPHALITEGIATLVQDWTTLFSLGIWKDKGAFL